MSVLICCLSWWCKLMYIDDYIVLLVNVVHAAVFLVVFFTLT